MPDPINPGQVQDASSWNPPSGEMSLDDLFQNPELVAQQPAPVQPPVQPAPVEDFLKASTGTVYRSREEAIRGTEEKDRTIERLKAQIQQQSQPAPSATQPSQTEDEYAKGIFKRFSDAASANDHQAYLRTLAEFQMSQLAPFAGLLSEVAKEKAIRAMEPEAQDFRQFVGSSEYTRTLEQFPTLKDAIRNAEANPQMAGQLGEFYKLAYRSYKAEHAGEAAAQQIVQQVPAPTPARPTLSPSTPSLPPTGVPQRSAQMSRDQVLGDRNARREFLKRYESENGGALQTQWSSVGL